VGPDPKTNLSGETDVTGRISKAGDAMVRTALYEAANVILERSAGDSPLRRWPVGGPSVISTLRAG
jgi:transposase